MTRHSPSDILTALAVAARLVELHGEEFLPIFEAMELEAAALNQRNSAMERARAMAAKAREVGIVTGYIPGHKTGYIGSIKAKATPS